MINVNCITNTISSNEQDAGLLWSVGCSSTLPNELLYVVRRQDQRVPMYVYIIYIKTKWYYYIMREEMRRKLIYIVVVFLKIIIIN